jgi:hypothetical protein
MKLDGFETKIGRLKDGSEYTDFYLKEGGSKKSIRLMRKESGDIIIEVVINGAPQNLTPGDRLTSPVWSEELELRMLKAMAVHNMGAVWLEDGFTELDIEMIRRGFDIGTTPGGEMLWYKREIAAMVVVLRDKSKLLPGAFTDPGKLVVIGPTKKELVAKTEDFRSLLGLIDSNAHYDLFQPYHNVEIGNFFLRDGITTH